jgi:hypothetical protein
MDSLQGAVARVLPPALGSFTMYHFDRDFGEMVQLEALSELSPVVRSSSGGGGGGEVAHTAGGTNTLTIHACAALQHGATPTQQTQQQQQRVQVEQAEGEAPIQLTIEGASDLGEFCSQLFTLLGIETITPMPTIQVLDEDFAEW